MKNGGSFPFFPSFFGTVYQAGSMLQPGGGFCNPGGSGWTALQLDAGHPIQLNTAPCITLFIAKVRLHTGLGCGCFWMFLDDLDH